MSERTSWRDKLKLTLKVLARDPDTRVGVWLSRRQPAHRAGGPPWVQALDLVPLEEQRTLFATELQPRMNWVFLRQTFLR